MDAKVDPKRTVKARVVHVFEDDGSALDGIDAEPGDVQLREDDRLMFACPGCARWGSISCAHPKPTEKPSWDVVKGSLKDPTALTLHPSIFCTGCCQWHGHLVDGVFKSV